MLYTLLNILSEVEVKGGFQTYRNEQRLLQNILLIVAIIGKPLNTSRFHRPTNKNTTLNKLSLKNEETKK